MITFSDIKDVYEVLEVTVFDDNGDYNYEFLGKVSVKIEYTFTL